MPLTPEQRKKQLESIAAAATQGGTLDLAPIKAMFGAPVPKADNGYIALPQDQIEDPNAEKIKQANELAYLKMMDRMANMKKEPKMEPGYNNEEMDQAAPEQYQAMEKPVKFQGLKQKLKR